MWFVHSSLLWAATWLSANLLIIARTGRRFQRTSEIFFISCPAPPVCVTVAGVILAFAVAIAWWVFSCLNGHILLLRAGPKVISPFHSVPFHISFTCVVIDLLPIAGEVGAAFAALVTFVVLVAIGGSHYSTFVYSHTSESFKCRMSNETTQKTTLRQRPENKQLSLPSSN